MQIPFSTTISYLLDAGFQSAETAVILGTGLTKLLDEIEIIQSVPYSEIPGFPAATNTFHNGRLIYGNLKGKPVLMMQGRFHFYEGYTMQEVVYPVRIMKLLGAQQLLISNAAGGLDTSYKKGDLVLIDDHINLQTANPLTGKNQDALGPRFPDMSMPYDKALSTLLSDTAIKQGYTLKKGVYAAVNGPNLETRAEYRFLKIIGADMVGMSTVPEVIAANHMGLPCAAVSVITDECDPDNLHPVNIEEIIKIAGEADIVLSKLFAETITNSNHLSK